MSDQERTATESKARLPWRRLLAGVLLAVALPVAALAWLGGTTGGLRAALAVSGLLLPGKLEAQGVTGTLVGGFAVERLALEVDGTTAGIEGLRLVPGRLVFSPLQLELSEVAAERVAVAWPASTAPATPPNAIGLPFELRIARLTVAQAEIGGVPVRALAAAGFAAGASGYAVADLRGEFGDRAAPLHAQARGSVAAATPFAVEVQAQLRETVAGAEVQADATAHGSLRALVLAAQLRGHGGSGTVEATLDAFGTPALHALRADIADFDPAAWSAGAPRARLRIAADLTSSAGSAFGLAGTVGAANAAPAPFDRGGLPLRQASARIVWTAERLSVADFDASLAAGRVRGAADIALDAAYDLTAQLTLEGVGSEHLLTTLRPLRIDGELRMRRAAEALHVAGRLRHRGAPTVDAELDLAIDRQRVEARRLRLRAGAGRADFSGRAELTGAGAFELAGSIERFDPGLLLRDVDGSLGGRVEARGQRTPLRGRLSFELAEASRLLGRPLAGRGAAELADGRATVEASLTVRSARLAARGALGANDGRIAVELAVPDLRELALPVAGGLNAQATISGAWESPAVELALTAERLAYGDQSVQSVDARGSYAGGADGALTATVTLGGHAVPERPGASLRSARLTAAGTLLTHSLKLTAETELAQTLRVAAAGGWRATRWRGQLTELATGTPLAVALAAPAALSAGAAGFDFGPADFTLPQARLEAVRVTLDGERFASSGRLAQWTVERSFGDTANPAPLTLRGDWDFKLGAQADGRLRIERAGGDLRLPTGEPLGVQTARLTVALEANRLRAEALLRAQRAGDARAEAQVEIERSGAGWRLAPQRPLAASLSAELHDLGFAALFLSEQLRDNLRVGGRLAADLRAHGTPAQPRTEGRLHGDGLRLAWIEQGVRLQDGRLRAHLEDAVLVLDEFRIAGAARGVPADARVARAVGNTPGAATLTGRFDLRERRGAAQLQAQRLPLLQRPDRWLIASGTTEIELDRSALRIAGNAVADAGLVDIGRPELPRLSDDVRVLGAEPRGTAASPIRLVLDLGFDMGPALYLRGRGLDARLAGQLRLRAESLASLRANGTISALDGTYTAFGHRLVLDRARLNLQGPIDNAGVDVLAVRRDLPVVVGVAITRTVADQLIRLYSDPVMNETETLSWLVLGRAPDSDRLDNPLLARAALALFAGNEEGLPVQLMRQLGIDELTIRSGTVGSPGSLLPQRTVAGNLRSDSSVGTTREILVVGRRINESLTVTFEQALGTAASALLVAYRLSDRLSAVAQAGSNNALNLVYSVAFD